MLGACGYLVSKDVKFSYDREPRLVGWGSLAGSEARLVFIFNSFHENY